MKYTKKHKHNLKYSKNTKKTKTQKHSTKKLNKSKQEVELYTNSLGVKIITMPYRNDSETAAIYFYFKIGSKNEPNHLSGISHFLEHMIFKGSKKYEKYIDISKTFDKLGISFNAYTSKELTVYYFKFISTSQNLDLICKITQDMVFNPLMDEKEIKNERNVIIQELKDDEDDIDEEIDDKIEEILFDGNTLGRCIIGTIKSLNNISKQDLVNYHQQYYKLDNLIIGLSGNIPSSKQYLNIINKYFSKTITNNKTITKLIPLDTQIQYQPTTFINHQQSYLIKCIPKSLSQNYIHIMFKTKGFNDPDKLIQKFIGNILGGNMSSRLFVEIREKLGLVYSIKCDYNSFEEVGYFDIISQTEVDDTYKCVRKILEELDKMKSIIIPDEEIESNKTNYVNNLKISFDDIEVENEFYSKQLIMSNKIELLEDVISRTNNITSKDIMRVSKELFNFNNNLIICIFGKCKKTKIEKIIKHFLNQ